MAVAEESIRGKTRPDMSRNEGLAGQTVTKGDYEYTYDDNGYAKKAINVKNRQEREQEGYGGGGYSGGRDSSYYDSLQPTDLSGYLNDMYKAYTDAQLAALKSAYEQNLAGMQADAEKIPGIYQGARNEAASQNDIARMAFNEYANARGLNTGTSGQAALANSAVLQSNLTDISTKESDAIAENALQQQQLAIEYRNAAVQAQAEGNYQMAQALYNEYVRQDNAAMQTAQLAQEQANWEAQFNAGNSQWQQQFDASQQEYQDSLSAQNREYAYNLAMTMLAAGVMPDTNTLNEAGISTADALNMRLAAMSTGGSGGGRSGSSGGGKPKMTLTTAKQAANAGVFSDDVLSVLRENGYTDEMLEAIYGYEPNRDVSGTSGNLHKADRDTTIRGNSSGRIQITDVSQLGPAAMNIANAMSRSNSASQLGTIGEMISNALERGQITEAEADFLLRSIGV